MRIMMWWSMIGQIRCTHLGHAYLSVYISCHMGNSKPGRPCTTYLACIQHLFGYEEGIIQADQRVTLAHDYTARLLFTEYHRRVVTAKYNPVKPRSCSATVLLQHIPSRTIALLCYMVTVTRLHCNNPMTGHRGGNLSYTAELTARHMIME